MKTILITGGQGFIGRNLVEGLQSSYKVLAPTHSELDLTDRDAVRNYASYIGLVDRIVHCATVGDCTDDKTSDIKMFLNLMDLGIPIINIGSGAEYGKQKDIVNANEDLFGAVVPSDNYGFSKYVIRHLIYPYTNITHLSLFGVYGKYEDCQRRFISNAIMKSLEDKPIVIYKDLKFSYLFVDDLIRIVKWFLDRDPITNVFSVGGIQTTLKEIAHRINILANKHVPIKILNDEIGNEYTCDDSKLRNLLGETQGYYTPLAEGILNLYTWYAKNNRV